MPATADSSNPKHRPAWSGQRQEKKRERRRKNTEMLVSWLGAKLYVSQNSKDMTIVDASNGPDAW